MVDSAHQLLKLVLVLIRGAAVELGKLGLHGRGGRGRGDERWKGRGERGEGGRGRGSGGEKGEEMRGGKGGGREGRERGRGVGVRRSYTWCI